MGDITYPIEDISEVEESWEQSQFTQQKIQNNLRQLSPQSLLTILEFSSYLVQKEIEEATEDIQEIPNIRQKLKEAEDQVQAGELLDWEAEKYEL